MYTNSTSPRSTSDLFATYICPKVLLDVLILLLHLRSSRHPSILLKYILPVFRALLVFLIVLLKCSGEWLASVLCNPLFVAHTQVSFH